MERKIYFCGSIRGGTQDSVLYERLVQLLKTYGRVLTEPVFITRPGEKDIKDNTNKFCHDLADAWLKETDYMVAEVTQPSLGVGYEIGRGFALGLKILCLYRPQLDKSLSAMIAGAENGSSFIVKEYTESLVNDIFKEFFRG